MNRINENKEQFRASCDFIIETLPNDMEIQENFDFYKRISEAILNDDTSISYEEKAKFLFFHMTSVKLVNDTFNMMQ